MKQEKNNDITKKFNFEFEKLNNSNQDYIVGIIQALLFAQSTSGQKLINTENEKKIE